MKLREFSESPLMVSGAAMVGSGLAVTRAARAQGARGRRFMPRSFSQGIQVYSDAGRDIPQEKRGREGAKKPLVHAGCKGKKVMLLVVADSSIATVRGDATTDMPKRPGYDALDPGMGGIRHAQVDPPRRMMDGLPMASMRRPVSSCSIRRGARM